MPNPGYATSLRCMNGVQSRAHLIPWRPPTLSNRTVSDVLYATCARINHHCSVRSNQSAEAIGTSDQHVNDPGP